jgi:hypothetical protein
VVINQRVITAVVRQLVTPAASGDTRRDWLCRTEVARILTADATPLPVSQVANIPL